MPEMKSPDGTETLNPPTEEGARVLRALGWTGGTTRSTSSASAEGNEERPRRGPGRPRKNPEG